MENKSLYLPVEFADGVQATFELDSATLSREIVDNLAENRNFKSPEGYVLNIEYDKKGFNIG